MSLCFERGKVISAVKCACSKIAVVEGARRVLAFILYVFDVVAQAFFIRPQFAIAAQLILLVENGLLDSSFMTETVPATGGLLRRSRRVGL